MILDILYLLATAILKIIVLVFGLIPFQPQLAQFTEAIAWLFTPLKYLAGVIDTEFLAGAIRDLIIFEVAWYTYKIVLGMIHWIKLKGHHPTAHG